MSAVTQQVRRPGLARAARPSLAPLAWGAASLGSLLIVWVLLTVTGLIGPNTLPAPTTVALTVIELLLEPFGGATLLGHAFASLSRWVIGVGVAVVVGVPLGALMGWVPVLRSAVTPAFEIVRYIPPIAWIPMAVLWFGAGLTAQAMVVFLAAFPACVINSQLGVARVDPILLKAGQNLGAGQMRILTHAVLPVAAPSILAGVRIALSNGWMAIVGAELVVGTEGLGFLITQGQANGSTPVIIAGMIAIGLFGVLVDIAVRSLAARSIRWRMATTGGR